MLDDRTAERRDTDAAHRRLWNNSSSRLGWHAYLNGADPNIAVPASRGDLRGLPTTWLGVGTLDVLYGESTAYARRLQAAEVHCELKTVPGAFHGFDAVAPKAAVTANFLRISGISCAARWSATDIGSTGPRTRCHVNLAFGNRGEFASHRRPGPGGGRG